MIYRSPEPDIEIPDVTLYEHVISGAAERGDHPAFVEGASGEVTTYAQLAERWMRPPPCFSRRESGRATSSGWSARTPPVGASPTTRSCAPGAVVTPMFALLTPEEIERQMANSEAKLLIDDPPAFVAEAEPGGNARRGGGGSRGPRRPAVLERHHGTDEGGDAHPSQPGGEHRAGLELDAADRRGRPGRPDAVLPHLRPDGRAEHGPRQGIDDRDDASLRSRRAARDRREARRHLAAHRSPDRARVRHRAGGRGARHLSRSRW